MTSSIYDSFFYTPKCFLLFLFQTHILLNDKHLLISLLLAIYLESPCVFWFPLKVLACDWKSVICVLMLTRLGFLTGFLFFLLHIYLNFFLLHRLVHPKPVFRFSVDADAMYHLSAVAMGFCSRQNTIPPFTSLLEWKSSLKQINVTCQWILTNLRSILGSLQKKTLLTQQHKPAAI